MGGELKVAAIISLPMSQNLCVGWGIAFKEGDGVKTSNSPLPRAGSWWCGAVGKSQTSSGHTQDVCDRQCSVTSLGFGGLVMNDNMDPAPPAATAGSKHTSASKETLCQQLRDNGCPPGLCRSLVGGIEDPWDTPRHRFSAWGIPRFGRDKGGNFSQFLSTLKGNRLPLGWNAVSVCSSGQGQ